MGTQYSDFGQFLKTKRDEKRIPIRKFAEMVGMSASYLSDIEQGRRNAPDVDKLERIATALALSDEDRTVMLDLAGKNRKTVAPDLPDYIMGREYVAAALRTARDLDAGEAEWMRFVEDLKKRKEPCH